jgi:predicted PhzF superfamily epimerase YddE/YHI9
MSPSSQLNRGPLRDVMRVWIVDAFAEKPFAGNRAGVCLLNDSRWPDEEWMRQVADELNAETAFAYPLDESGSAWRLRWFTAEAESNICGHATLAITHVLHHEHPSIESFAFETGFGTFCGRAREDESIGLDFPAAPLTQVPVPQGLREAIRAQPLATYRTGDLGDLLVRIGDENEIRALRPDSVAIADLCRRESLRGIIVTAPARSSDCSYDFVSRFFSGAWEDAVTGSAHTALAPYWAAELGASALTGLQASSRAGHVHVELHNDRVHLFGSAVTTVEGHLHTPI